MSQSQRARNYWGGIQQQQLKDYAFTVRGWAMEDPMNQQGLHDTICAYSPAMYPVHTVINQAQSDPNSTIQLFNDNKNFTDRELGEPEDGVCRYLVVGYAPRDLSDAIKKTAPWCKKQRPVGNETPSADQIIKWDESKPPVLVVVRVEAQKTKGTQLWALLKPKNGLCTPFPIAQNLVFYRWQYRDNTTAINERGPAWNRRVVLHSTLPGRDEEPPLPQQEAIKQAENAAILAYNPRISICKQIEFLATGFDESRTEWFIEKLGSLLRVIDEDIDARPAPQNNGLRIFIEEGSNLTVGQAEMVVEDFNKMWPGVSSVIQERIQVLKQQLVFHDIELEHRLVMPFIAEGCRLLSKQDYQLDIQDLVESVRTQAGTVDTTPPPGSSSPTEQPLTKILILKLQEIMDASNKIDEGSKWMGDVALDPSSGDIAFDSNSGDAAFDLSQDNMQGQYRNTCDADTARACILQIGRMIAAAIAKREKDSQDIIQEIMTVLENIV
ncbi:hypothetical protein BP6252_13266 [Coleophoma cylindrospora]|uniref:Uncharacterized protein n=1 Tax=Coleophoma cylindrospora TaxID=1849047 RepID=A0A3D8QAW8_9HELO|nr:hypothetical protein BP6252_13266 [Coleophoma cylindrospora]